VNYELFMGEALAEARAALSRGERPHAAVAVVDEAMVARAHDRRAVWVRPLVRRSAVGDGFGPFLAIRSLVGVSSCSLLVALSAVPLIRSPPFGRRTLCGIGGWRVRRRLG